MEKTSSIFLRNMTCIDHAFVNEDGFVVGGSFHPEIVLTGTVTMDEAVVLDFSKAKKHIKDIIDDKEKGFDHKLWLVKGWSGYSIKELGNGYSEVTTKYYTIVVPSNALKIIDEFHDGSNPLPAIERQMAREIEEGLVDKGFVGINVDLHLAATPFTSDPNLFTYFHGLKNSSSWGCQNPVHGHLSFVEVVGGDGERIKIVEEMIAAALNNSLLIFEENYSENGNKGIVKYETERGAFMIEFDKETVKHIIMEDETTIENIVEWVEEVFQYSLEFFGAKTIYISEGLQKGAMKNLS